MKFDISATGRTALIILLGNAMYAFAVTFVIVPSGLILGGFTGLSIALNHFTGINVSYVVLFSHTTVFIFGALILGKHFAISTAASTFLYPIFLHFFELLAKRFALPFIHTLSIRALLAAILIGVSLGILTRNQTSTGGTEVIPMIVHKLTGRSIGFVLLILDGMIMFIQLTYSDFVQILYGIAIVILYSGLVQLISGKKQIPISNSDPNP